MKNWLLGLGLFSVTMGCAVGADEEGDWEVSGETDVNSVEQANIPAINAKRASNSWLGDSTSGFNEYSGGVVRIYENGAILHGDAVDRAHTMVKDQYRLWTWIGKSSFGFPDKDRYTSLEDSKITISRGPKGFILSTSKNVIDDAWPIMRGPHGSIHVNGDWGPRHVAVTNIQKNQLETNFTVSGAGFPPNTDVMIGVSMPKGSGLRRTVTTNASGSFSHNFTRVAYYTVGTHNSVETVWARTADKGAAAVWSGYDLIPDGVGLIFNP